MRFLSKAVRWNKSRRKSRTRCARETRRLAIDGLEPRTMLTTIIADPFEPNDGFGSATRIGPGGQVNGAYIARNGDEDFYRWVATESGRVSVDLLFRHSDGDLDLLLYNSRGRLLDSSRSAANNERVSASVTVGETYYIRVVGDEAPPFGGTTCYGNICRYIPTVPRTAPYRLVVNAPTDSNDQVREAESVSLGVSRTGCVISTGSDVDIFRFQVSAGERLAFDIDRAGGRLDSYIRLFDGSGHQLAFNDDGTAPGEPSGLESYLEHTFTNGGTYYLGVSGYGNSTYDAVRGTGDRNGSSGPYTLLIRSIASPDNNDQLSETDPISLGVPRTGYSISTATDVDMFRFEVSSGRRLAFDIDRAGGSLNSYIRLFDSAGRQLGFNDDGGAPGELASLESYLEYTFSSGGTYYLGVSGYGNPTYDAIRGTGDRSGSSGAYTLMIRA